MSEILVFRNFHLKKLVGWLWLIHFFVIHSEDTDKFFKRDKIKTIIYLGGEMYFIEELEMEIPEKELIKEALKFGLVYQAIPPNRIIICEKEKEGVINAPALSGIRKKPKKGQVVVIFKAPVYDMAYPYPGSSEKLVEFLELLHQKYGGKLKMRKEN